MIDAVISSAAGVLLTGTVSVILFRLNIRKREEIMMMLTVFREQVNALRTALETEKLYRPKDREVIAEVNRLELEFMAVYGSMRWPWFSRRKRREVFRAFCAFKTTFDAFQWVNCNQAGPLNRAKATEFARLLTGLLIAMQ